LIRQFWTEIWTKEKGEKRVVLIDWVPGRAKSLIRLFLHRPNETFLTIPEIFSSEQKSPLGVFREYWRFKSRWGPVTPRDREFSSFNSMNRKSLIRLRLDNMLDHAWALPRGNPSARTPRGYIYDVYVRWLSPPVLSIGRTTLASGYDPVRRFNDLSLQNRP
jgi:hypothetical protein